MIIVRTSDSKAYYAASKKSVPGLISDISSKTDSGIEKTISEATYFEFNTRQNRTGAIGPFSPVAELVTVSCGLSTAAATAEEVAEETTDDE